MSYLHYVLPATLTFLIAVYAFFRDTEASKGSILNWTFVLVTGLLWPITLPFIIWKKLSTFLSLGRAEHKDELGFKFRQSHTI